MEAKAAYAKGKPIMSDEDFDEMKRNLKLRDSRICAQVCNVGGPRIEWERRAEGGESDSERG